MGQHRVRHNNITGIRKYTHDIRQGMLNLKNKVLYEEEKLQTCILCSRR